MAIINDNLDELLKMPGRLEQFGTKCRRAILKSAHPLRPLNRIRRRRNLSAKGDVSGRVVPIVVLSGGF